MKWVWEGKTYDDAEVLAWNLFTEDDLGTEDFDDDLDNCYPKAEIAGITFFPSQILKKCDPVAYDCGFSDWASGVMEEQYYPEIVKELEAMEPGETLDWVYSIHFNFESPVQCLREPDEDEIDEGWDDP